MNGDGTKGHLDLVLLGILAGEAGHGYAIISALKTQTDGVLDLPEGSVYPALHRLEDRGLVASEWKAVGGRRRRVYRLTDDGLAWLASERRDWARLAGAIDAVLANAVPKPGQPGRRLAGGLA